MNYIDDDEFRLEMDKWRESSDVLSCRIPSERLGEIFLKLHDGVLLHKKFIGYPSQIKEDMRSYSLERIFKRGLFTFKFGNQSPFRYFTCGIFMNYICWLRQHYKKRNRQNALLRLAASSGVQAYPAGKFFPAQPGPDFPGVD